MGYFFSLQAVNCASNASMKLLIATYFCWQCIALYQVICCLPRVGHVEWPSQTLWIRSGYVLMCLLRSLEVAVQSGHGRGRLPTITPEKTNGVILDR